MCRIYNNSIGTGFFIKFPFNSKLKPVLITNNHIIGKNDIISNSIITLKLNSNKEEKNRNR